MESNDKNLPGASPPEGGDEGRDDPMIGCTAASAAVHALLKPGWKSEVLDRASGTSCNDLQQDAQVSYLEYVEKYGTPKDPKALAHQIARNTVTSARRKRSDTKSPSADPLPDDAEDWLSTRTDSSLAVQCLLDAVFRKVSPKDKKLLEARLQEQKYAEIAQGSQQSAAAIKAHFHRVCQFLRANSDLAAEYAMLAH